MSVLVEERVESLEIVLEQYIRQSNAIISRMDVDARAREKKMDADAREREKNTNTIIRQLHADGRDREERTDKFIRQIHADAREREKNTNKLIQEIRAEIEEIRAHTKKIEKVFNKKWGALANKTGTMVEDLVYPSLGRIIREQFGVDVDQIAPRVTRWLGDGREKEYDAFAFTKDTLFLNSTKSRLNKVKHVEDFLEDIRVSREYFPEHADKKIIGILAGLSVSKPILNRAQKEGFLVLATGENLMDVQNRIGFQPKEF